MENDKLKIGEVVALKGHGEKNGTLLHAEILEIKNDSRLIVKLPHHRGEPIDKGPMTLEFLRQNSIYHLETHIEFVFAKASDAEHVTLMLGPPSEVRRIQRREYYRLAIDILVRFASVTLPKGFKEDAGIRRSTIAAWIKDEKITLAKARSFDLSGGGLGITTSADLKVNENVFVEFLLEERVYRVAARVALSLKHGPALNHVGLEFIGLAPAEQDEIIRYVFRHQTK